MELTCLLLLIGMFALTLAKDLAYRHYLLLKAEKNRTAVCIKGQFFYIVPEAEYCDLTLDARRWRQSQGDNK